MIKHQHNKTQKIDLFLSWQEYCQDITTVGLAEITVSLVLLWIYIWHFLDLFLVHE